MAGNKENVKMGSAWFAYAPFGGNGKIRWLGYSEGGPSLSRAPDREDIYVDQLSSPIFSRVTAENMTATFPSVELTRENLLLAFPGSKLSSTGRIDIYPESSVQQSNMGGILVIHPAFAGEPIGDFLDPSALGAYDSSYDVMFVATLASELDLSFGREDMIHIPFTFNATNDPVNRLAVWLNPFTTDFAITGATLSDEGTTASGTLAAAGASNPVFAIPNAKGWSLEGTTLTFTLDEEPAAAVTYQTLVYAKDADEKIGFVVAKATLAPES
jgi:hypothetical protein